jgi:hypothetical protein
MAKRDDIAEPFRCQAECTKETAKAIFCKLESGEERWIPNTVVHDDSEVYQAGHEGELVLHAWWAEKEGLS